MKKLVFSQYPKPAGMNRLSSLQQRLDIHSTYQLQVEKVQDMWDKKSNSQRGKAAFDDLKTCLLTATVGVELCNYCEQNEATDIEHIYPKSVFPNRAFQWKNYLLACSNCNSRHKKDKFSIFVPRRSCTIQNVTPQYINQVRLYTQPLSTDAVLINPRFENPLDFLFLDLTEKTFTFLPINTDPQSRCYQKAFYTIETLGLNSRPALVNARGQAAQDYLNRLAIYIKVREAKTFDELEDAINDFPTIDFNTQFYNERERLVKAIRQDILEFSHPTVWEELKRQRNQLKKAKQLFLDAPEALTW